MSHARSAQDFTIQNIVASCDVKFPIRLEGLAFAHASFANVRPRPRLRCASVPCLWALIDSHSRSPHAPPVRVQYEPELFPGLIYRMRSPKIVLLVFVSGKVVLTGGKNRDDVYEAFENIYPVLTEFRKTERAALPLPAPGDAAGGSGAGAA